MQKTANQSILVTGGAGYIGSHTLVELLAEGYEVVVVDNLVNSSREAIKRVEKISGKQVPLIVADLRDEEAMRLLIGKRPFSAVIHFAALKAVGESVAKPLSYYDNNISGTLTLLKCMQEAGLKKIVFSSSATVYGDPEAVPITENAKVGATNPYGQTKAMIEQVLNDIAATDSTWSVANLRYFNPVGAHVSGLIGEDPKGIPNNLLPFVAQVAIGRREKLSVYGNDWPTPDGTGVRDYIHVVDLAKGHVAALRHTLNQSGAFTVNLGTGRGYSVLDMVAAYEKACAKPVPYAIEARRPGDIATCYADPSYAQSLLGWSAQLSVERMCEDSWRWQTMNPNGYGA
jgi:UDP-glucose 4-epimerase